MSNDAAGNESEVESKKIFLSDDDKAFCDKAVLSLSQRINLSIDNDKWEAFVFDRALELTLYRRALYA